MGHGSEKFTTERVINLDGVWDDHSLEGAAFNQSDLLFHDGKYWIAVKEGDDFHLRLAKQKQDRFYFHAEEAYGHVHRPIHPDMEFEDIEGATYAYDDGTYWLFAHCSPQEQVDYAVEVEDYIFGLFTKDILAAALKEQLNADLATRTAALYKAKGIKRFAHAASKAGYNIVITATLGHFHRDPHNDHKREIAIASINEVLTRWKENGKTDNDLDSDRIRAEFVIPDILTHLKSTHTIEWRHERVNRLADAGTDPVDGYEYVYTTKENDRKITETQSLPDPNWVVDHVGQSQTTPVVRSTQPYWDGEPTTTPGRQWIIRFRRPVPEGKVAGDKIGAVVWEQEPAYKKPVQGD